MQEEKLNNQLLRLSNISVLIGLLLWGVALYGLSKHPNPFEASSISSFFLIIINLKYQLLDVVAGAIIILLSVTIINIERKRVNDINKPWDVKQPENITDFYKSIEIDNEIKYRNRNQ